MLLVYKAKAIGAYLLQKPSGEVTGLVTAAKAGADAAAAQDPAENAPPQDGDAQAAQTQAAAEESIEYPTE